MVTVVFCWEALRIRLAACACAKRVRLCVLAAHDDCDFSRKSSPELILPRREVRLWTFSKARWGGGC
eukprot:6359139-Prymnesium_polylepis.1